MIRSDITSKTYGNLKVIGWLRYVLAGKSRKTRSLWLCKCKCGNYRHVIQAKLTGGCVTSCGCVNKNGKLIRVSTGTTKICPKCSFVKELSLFYKNGTYCKDCYRNYRRSNYDPVKQSIKSKLSYVKNRTKRLAYYKKYKALNPDKVKATLVKWKKNNPNYKKLKWKSDLNFRIKENLRGRLYKAVSGLSKSNTTLHLLGCTIEDLRVHLEAQFQSGMTWDNYGEWHIDHKKPCASFDLTDSNQQKQCFHYTNLQPLWAIDNLIKSKKWEV